MIIPLPNFANGGLNTDIVPWDLPPEFLSEGKNFRVESNSIITYNGHKVFAEAPAEYKPAYTILARTRDGNSLITAGKDKIYSYRVGYTDITGGVSVADGNEFDWSGCLNGSIVILNNQNYHPVYWDGNGDVQDLPWDIDSGITTTWKDKGYRAAVVRSHKNYLIAMNLDDTQSRRDSFRWSHPADENAVPFTWDPNNPAGTAGIQPLGGDGGTIIDGLSLRDSFVIYSQKAINVIDLSGDEFIWRRRELSTTIGLLSKDCVVEVKGIHYILTRGDIVTNDGNTIVSIAHDKIQKRLQNLNTDYVDRAFVFSNDRKKEIWFCVPDGQSTTVNVAFIYQWKLGVWSIRDLPVGTSFLASAPELRETGASWNSDLDSWDSDITVWNSDVSAISYAQHPYATNHTYSQIHLMDTDDIVDDLETEVERTDLALVDQVNVTTITRLYPQMQGSNPVEFRVGSQQRVNGEVRWKNWKKYSPDSDRKIDVRTTGALHCFAIRSIGKGAFRFAGMDVEYEVDGIR